MRVSLQLDLQWAGAKIQVKGSPCIGSAGKDDDHFGSSGMGILHDFRLLIEHPWIPSLESLSFYI
jgi:hypothetical protein